MFFVRFFILMWFLHTNAAPRARARTLSQQTLRNASSETSEMHAPRFKWLNLEICRRKASEMHAPRFKWLNLEICRCKASEMHAPRFQWLGLYICRWNASETTYRNADRKADPQKIQLLYPDPYVFVIVLWVHLHIEGRHKKYFKIWLWALQKSLPFKVFLNISFVF